MQNETSLSLQINVYIRKHLIKHTQRHSQKYHRARARYHNRRFTLGFNLNKIMQHFTYFRQDVKCISISTYDST